ncbi:TetR/AcrR family transcriptional regulator [Streptomyces sp. GSL17-111]|uniref:TetR/AcrR family transcriptional regulator n=1 Tax=Streptomyces sp. GSL17-111 TaxID=3121596 RepID=UPI0030F3E2B5
MALLDAAGPDAFSMRRLAAELGVTAMSLYWYVDSKDDLLELALDAVQGELPLPAPEDDWRSRLRALATAYRSVLVAHPWMAGLVGQYLNVGPNAMDFARAAQSVMTGAGLPPERLPGALGPVFHFAYGFSSIEANWNARCASTGLSPDAFYQYVLGKVAGRPEYAESLQLRDAAGSGSVDAMREQDFDTALTLLVAGIEALRPAAPGT